MHTSFIQFKTICSFSNKFVYFIFFCLPFILKQFLIKTTSITEGFIILTKSLTNNVIVTKTFDSIMQNNSLLYHFWT